MKKSTIALIVSAAVIGGLSVTVLPILITLNPQSLGDDAYRATARTNIVRLSNALDRYSLDMLDYPTQEQGLGALISAPDTIPDGAIYSSRAYIVRPARDPWGQPFVYKRPGTRSGREYDLYSLGADGAEGGEGKNADIGNWD